MLKDWDALAQKLSGLVGEIRAGLPFVMKGILAMANAATATGAFSEKTKELIALALGIVARCDSCLAFHSKALVKRGAMREEGMETISMSVYMEGGSPKG